MFCLHFFQNHNYIRWITGLSMPARRGLLAPQNTFLDTIATRFDGTRKYKLEILFCVIFTHSGAHIASVPNTI